MLDQLGLKALKSTRSYERDRDLKKTANDVDGYKLKSTRSYERDRIRQVSGDGSKGA